MNEVANVVVLILIAVVSFLLAGRAAMRAQQEKED